MNLNFLFGISVLGLIDDKQVIILFEKCADAGITTVMLRERVTGNNQLAEVQDAQGYLTRHLASYRRIFGGATGFKIRLRNHRDVASAQGVHYVYMLIDLIIKLEDEDL